MADLMASIMYFEVKNPISKAATIEKPRNIEVTFPTVPRNAKESLSKWLIDLTNNIMYLCTYTMLHTRNYLSNAYNTLHAAHQNGHVTQICPPNPDRSYPIHLNWNCNCEYKTTTSKYEFIFNKCNKHFWSRKHINFCDRPKSARLTFFPIFLWYFDRRNFGHSQSSNSGFDALLTIIVLSNKKFHNMQMTIY